MSALRLRSISARTFVGGSLVAGLLALALLSLLARSAGATETRFGSSGEGAGQFIDAAGLAIDQASGDVYTADSLDGRVDELQSSGTFVRAWGWGVLDGEQKSESCTGPCFAGVLGAGVGEFFYPRA
jgi:hypothetical protein